MGTLPLEGIESFHCIRYCVTLQLYDSHLWICTRCHARTCVLLPPRIVCTHGLPTARHGWARVVRTDKGMTTMGASPIQLVVLSVCGCLVGSGWMGWMDGWVVRRMGRYASLVSNTHLCCVRPLVANPVCSGPRPPGGPDELVPVDGTEGRTDRCNAGLFWQSRNGWNGRMDGMDVMHKNGLESETFTYQLVSKPASCFLPPASCVPASCFLFSASCFLFPVSCFLFPVSCFLFPVSCPLLPAFCLPLPPPVSCFLLPASRFLLPTYQPICHKCESVSRAWFAGVTRPPPLRPSHTCRSRVSSIALGRLRSKRPLPTFPQSFHAGAETVREKPFTVAYSLHHVGSWMRVGCVVWDVLEENARNTPRLGFYSPLGRLASSVQVSPPQPRGLLQDPPSHPSHPISCVPIAYHADHATPHLIGQARIYIQNRGESVIAWVSRAKSTTDFTLSQWHKSSGWPSEQS